MQSSALLTPDLAACNSCQAVDRTVARGTSSRRGWRHVAHGRAPQSEEVWFGGVM